jgi:hypothetical protein
MQFNQLRGGYLPGHGELLPWGVLFHTTGNGIPAKAVAESIHVLEAAVRVYTAMREGPHLIVPPCGRVLQVRNFESVAWHAGVSEAQRLLFLHEPIERWGLLPPGLEWWRKRWPGVKSPQHLYPTSSPNLAYLGVEMVPCGVIKGGQFVPLWGKPAHPGARFTLAQYVAAAELTLELDARYDLLDLQTISYTGPSSLGTYPLGARVCGHEDVNPVTRPGWDPGSLTGAWSWDTFNEVLTTLERNS